MADKVSLATLALAKAYTDAHGGGSGTDNYNDLTHKPTVNGVEFKGTMTGETLGLVNAENGKGLSANDYTDADKSIVGGVTSALAGKVDKVSGKGLSTNDYDDTAKGIVDGVTSALAGKMAKDPINNGATALNDTTDSGIYYCTTPSDAPDGITYFNMLVMKTNANSIRQVIFRSVTAEATIYTRAKGSSGWVTWYKFTPEDNMISAVKSAYDLTKDTVGWTNKNEFEPSTPSNQTHGVTATITDDKRVSLTGTADTAHVLSIGDFTCKANVKYILNGCPSGGGTESSNYWLDAYIVATSTIVNKDTGSGCELLFNADTTVRIRIRIPNGLNTAGMVYSPMIRKADILDPTFEPKRGTTAFPRDEQRVLGAKNLYDLIATSKTDQYGGVWTVNADKTITISGTPTAYEAFPTSSYNIIPVGSYILSWDNANVVNAGLDTLRLFKGNTEVRRITIPSSVSPVPFNITAEDDYDNIRVAFKRITNNEPMSGTIKPMICFATDTDSTFQQFAMTNGQLTLAIDGKLDKINGVFDDPSEPIVGEIYNSEEQVVGTWGKQGHEKTLYMSVLMSEGNIPFNTENSEIIETESHNIANIDEIVFAQFTCKPSSANVWSPLPHKKKYITIDRTDIIGYTSNSSNEQAAIKGLVYYTKTS